jgi:hypothetical protein
MRATRLARRLGLDRNPLRRRTDKIAACLAAVLAAVFLVGAPVLATVAVDWAGRATAAEQQAARSWRQVPAVLQQGASAPAGWELPGYSWVRARWTAPDGQSRAGEIPVSGAVPAGRAVPLWVNGAGSPIVPPPGHRTVPARQALAAVVAVAALGIVLLCLTGAGRLMLDRRRLADWEAGWAAVGPVWTRRFRSRGW